MKILYVDSGVVYSQLNTQRQTQYTATLIAQKQKTAQVMESTPDP